MMEIIRTADLDKGYKVLMVQSHKKESLGDFDLYDVEVRNSIGRTIVVLHTGCIGEKSGYMWTEQSVEYMEKLLFLVESREMACHNLMCYSKSLMMDEPKNGYEDEWDRANRRVQMLEKWLYNHTTYFGEKDARGGLIRLEWDIDKAWAE